MMSLLLSWIFYHFLVEITAYDNLEGGLKLGKPCFEVFEHPDCQSCIPEHFTAKSALAGSNAPNTSVFLFTPTNRYKAEQLHLCRGYLPPDSTYDPEVPTEIFIHGWLDGVCRSAWMREMKEQLFERGKYNVILVDWTWGNSPFYQQAGLNCRTVGEQVGFVIKNIMNQKNMGRNADKFHVIGHSFGAVASGYTGRSVKTLRRITALDPAFAPYQNAPLNQVATYRDAKIVDVIHSNAAECWYLGVGDPRPLGHGDFFVNGGSFQPSCYPDIVTSLLKGDILYALLCLEPRTCAHVQSIQYYKASINPRGCQFVGIASDSYKSFQNKNAHCRCRLKCAQVAVMGMDYELYGLPALLLKNQKIPRKKYFLTTSDTCPYYDNSYIGSRRFLLMFLSHAEKQQNYL